MAPKAGREESGGEGPEFSRPPSRNLDLFGNEDDNAEAERLAAERLTGARLTAQLKSGGAVKPSKLKPAENRGRGTAWRANESKKDLISAIVYAPSLASGVYSL
jgi:hypothetical protein